MSVARILIVEDERIVAMGLEAQLHNLGYEVVGHEASGAQAVETAERLQPDLVLMDIRLHGDMDGVEAARLIRRRCRVPVVFLTAYSNQSILERAKVTEPYGYILKPYEDRELHIVIEMAVYKHRMEQELHERERLFAATLQSIGDGVIATDTQARITLMNRAAESLTGWSDSDARGRDEAEVFRIVNEVSRKVVPSPLKQAIREGRSVPLANRTVLLARDGREILIDDRAAPIIDQADTIRGGVLVFRDVTERRQGEDALAKLAALVRCSQDAIISADIDASITSWNDGAMRLYGYGSAEALGRPLAFLVPPERADEFRATIGRIQRGEFVDAYETLRRAKDGSVVHVIATLSPIKDKEGLPTGFAAIHRDISELKRVEAQYRQAQKMEAVGRLAGGVAHDFNNLLTVINGYSGLILAGLHEHDSKRGLIEEVARAGERAAALVQQLLAYSRKQIVQLKVLDLNLIVAALGKMLRPLLGEDIELATELARELRPIKADPTQIEQVIMNLAVNARDAMPRGGRLTLRTRNVDVAEGHAGSASELPPGPYTVLVVGDTGVGMDAETMRHIFEPFFTTKETGQGTGLGLATVYGVVKQSGGHIQVESKPEAGTTFTLYFPSFSESPGRSARLSGEQELPAGNETILLVEDEAGVRSLARYVLQRCGYTVLDAANGVDALEIAARHAGGIDLVMTDVVMPGMNGREVAESLRQLRPATKVLFLSGYTEDAVVRHGIKESEAAFLAKPFAIATLAHKVREVLDSADGDEHGPAPSNAGLP
jgi:two-component system cell cycle sensor histidine kinase/response regulator CckA